MSIFQDLFQKITVIITSIVIGVTGVFIGPKPLSTPIPSPTPFIEHQVEVSATPSAKPVSKKPTPSPTPVKTETEIKLEQVTKELEEIKKSNSDENEAIKKRLDCEELKKKTPANGNFAYINRDIVKYYEDVTQNLERVKIKPTRENDPEDAAAELKFYTELTAEAKPMYNKYITECGN